MSQTVHIAAHGNWWTTSVHAFQRYGIYLGRLMKSMRSVQRKVFDKEVFAREKRGLPLALLTSLRKVSCPDDQNDTVTLRTTASLNKVGVKTERAHVKRDPDRDEVWDHKTVFGINGQCYLNETLATRHMGRHCPMPIAFLPPSNVSIASMLSAKTTSTTCA